MVMVPRPTAVTIGSDEWRRRWADWQPAPLLQESDDWRVLNARDLAGLTLHRAVWTPPGPGWDHDHCAGCFAKFTDLDLPDAVHDGWTTGDDWPWGPRAEWVCADCFHDLLPVLGWREAPAEDAPEA